MKRDFKWINDNDIGYSLYDNQIKKFSQNKHHLTKEKRMKNIIGLNFLNFLIRDNPKKKKKKKDTQPTGKWYLQKIKQTKD